MTTPQPTQPPTPANAERPKLTMAVTLTVDERTKLEALAAREGDMEVGVGFEILPTPADDGVKGLSDAELITFCNDYPDAAVASDAYDRLLAIATRAQAAGEEAFLAAKADWNAELAGRAFTRDDWSKLTLGEQAAYARIANDGSLILRLSDTIAEQDARIAELTEAEANARTDAEWHKARNAVLEADSALVPELVEALEGACNLIDEVGFGYARRASPYRAALAKAKAVLS